VPPLSILSLAIFLDYMISALATAYLAAGGERLTFWAVTLGAFTNICLNLILIPKYSLMGAAIATNLSYLFILFFYFGFIKRLNTGAI
jgi:O-antigen/teichoic acid export membrane protein